MNTFKIYWNTVVAVWREGMSQMDALDWVFVVAFGILLMFLVESLFLAVLVFVLGGLVWGFLRGLTREVE